MVNPGSFRGTRKEFLNAQKPLYKAAVQGGYAADCIADIQRRYFKRYSVDLPHDEEPSSEYLANVDDDTPDPEIPMPDPSTMSAEEYAEAEEALQRLDQLRRFRKAQIKRWMVSQYAKDRDLPARESGAHDPYVALLHRLTGVGLNKPRRKTAYNVWAKTQTETIEQQVRALVASRSSKPKDLAGIRIQVTRDLFRALADEEQREWEKQAVEDHELALKEWTEATTAPISSKPEDRQLCIERLPKFVQPILDIICEATGWKATLLVGGPEPADGGRLNVISVHSGTTTGNVPMNFGRSERASYKKFITPLFGRFLKKCYSVEDCRMRALLDECLCLSAQDTEDQNWTVENVDIIHNPTKSGDTSTVVGASCSPSRRSSPGVVPSLVVSQLSSSSISPLPVPSRPKSPGATPLSPSSRAGSPGVAPSRAVSRAGSPGVAPSRAVSRARSPSASPDVVPPGNSHPPSPPGLPCAELQSEHGKRRRRDDDDSMQLSDTAQEGIGPKQPCKRPRRSRTRGSRTSMVATSTKHSCQSKSDIPNVSTVATSSKDSTQPKSGTSDAPAAATSSENSTQPKSSTFDASAAATSSTNSPRLRSGSTNPSAVVTSSATTNSPPWLLRCYSMLDGQETKEWGDGWKVLVLKWCDLERAASHMDSSGTLGSTARPPAIGDWIKRARSPTWCPRNVDVGTYEAQFLSWWLTLQPEWRRDGNSLLPVATGSDWTALRVFGKNGLLSVVVALYFWARNIPSVTVEDLRWVAWRDALSDVYAVFQVL